MIFRKKVPTEEFEAAALPHLADLYRSAVHLVRDRSDAGGDHAGGARDLEEVHDDLEERRGEEDLDDRLVELLEELLPQGLSGQRRQAVGAEALPALGHAFGREAVFHRGRELFQDVVKGAHDVDSKKDHHG